MLIAGADSGTGSASPCERRVVEDQGTSSQLFLHVKVVSKDESRYSQDTLCQEIPALLSIKLIVDSAHRVLDAVALIHGLLTPSSLWDDSRYVLSQADYFFLGLVVASLLVDSLALSRR